MNITFNIPDDLVVLLRKRADDEGRSMANFVVHTVRVALRGEPKPKALPSWEAPKPETAKARALDRPHRVVLLSRGWSADWLDSLKPHLEAKLVGNGQTPNADGTALTVMTPDEAQVFREVAVAPDLDAVIQAEIDDIDFEE